MRLPNVFHFDTTTWTLRHLETVHYESGIAYLKGWLAFAERPGSVTFVNIATNEKRVVQIPSPFTQYTPVIVASGSHLIILLERRDLQITAIFVATPSDQQARLLIGWNRIVEIARVFSWPELDWFLFAAQEPGLDFRYRIWWSDGTTTNTHPLEDAEPTSYPLSCFAARLGQQALFSCPSQSANDNHWKLWRVDGTGQLGVVAQFPIPIHAIYGPCGHPDEEVIFYGRGAFEHFLWRTRGNPGDLQTLSHFSIQVVHPETDFCASTPRGTYFLFDAYPPNSTMTSEVWFNPRGSTDLQLLKTFERTWPRALAAISNAVLASVGEQDSPGRTTLYEYREGKGWRTFPNTDEDEEFGFAPAGGVLFFSAKSENEGRELWVFDPRTDRVELAANLNTATDSSTFLWPAPWKSGVVFGAKDAVWFTDGTPANTKKLFDVPGIAYGLGAQGDWVYFWTPSASSTGFVFHRWKEGMTAEELATHSCPGSWEAYGTPFFLGGRLYYLLRDCEQQIHVTAVSESGELMDIKTLDKTVSNPPQRPVVVPQQGLAYIQLAVSDPSSYSRPALWVTDGTAAGTKRLAETLRPVFRRPFKEGALVECEYIPVAPRTLCFLDPHSESASLLTPPEIVPFDIAVNGNTALFYGFDRQTQEGRWWVTRGTAEITSPLPRPRPGDMELVSWGLEWDYRSFVPLGNGILFSATVDGFGEQLWFTDFTPQGTVPLTRESRFQWRVMDGISFGDHALVKLALIVTTELGWESWLTFFGTVAWITRSGTVEFVEGYNPLLPVDDFFGFLPTKDGVVLPLASASAGQELFLVPARQSQWSRRLTRP